MELMNGAEFDQNHVIIGQQMKTVEHRVSDNPMLMSILSTNMYQNPLKSMIQEAVFNAWDAHKEAKTTHKAIEIFFTEDNQIIIADFGTGIPNNKIQEIYGTFGHSTKRNKNDQTGGFGIGCKAPYAYTETFRVTSVHEGVRTLYVMSRANDEIEGKPGITPLVSLPCNDHSGLVLSIPLKNDTDAQLAYKYLKHNILPYSGIKYTIDFKGQSEAKTECEIVPGTFVFDDMSQGGSSNIQKTYSINITHLIAQYGGVAYDIPQNEAYKKEYESIKAFSKDQASIRIGFPPASISPLPSREGLNMSERTVKNIKKELQLICSEISRLTKPVLKLAMERTAHYLWKRVYASAKVNNYSFSEERAYIKMADIGYYSNIANVLTHEEIEDLFASDFSSYSSDTAMFKFFLKFIIHNTNKAAINSNLINSYKALAWFKHFGGSPAKATKLRRYTNQNFDNIVDLGLNTTKHLYNLSAAIESISSVTGIRPVLRVKPPKSHSYCPIFSHIVEDRKPISWTEQKKREKKIKKGTFKTSERTKWGKWTTINGNFYIPDNSLIGPLIVVCETIKEGQECPSVTSICKNMTPFFVVGKKKGQKERVVKILKEYGVNVIIADSLIPIKTNKSLVDSKDPLPKIKHPILLNNSYNTVSAYQKEGPFDYWIRYSESQYKRENYTSAHLSASTVKALYNFLECDKIAVITHQHKVKEIKQTGAINVPDYLEGLINDALNDKKTLKKAQEIAYISETLDIPDCLVYEKQFFKKLGFACINKNNEQKVKNFIRLYKFVNENIKNTNLFPTDKHIRFIDLFTPIKIDEDKQIKINKLAGYLRLLDKRAIERHMQTLADYPREQFVNQLTKFITVSKSIKP